MKKLLLLLLIAICVSCQSRYWFRDKVRVKSPSSANSRQENLQIDSSLQASERTVYLSATASMEDRDEVADNSPLISIILSEKSIHDSVSTPSDTSRVSLFSAKRVPASVKRWNTFWAILFFVIAFLLIQSIYTRAPLVLAFEAMLVFNFFQKMITHKKYVKSYKHTRVSALVLIITGSIFLLWGLLIGPTGEAAASLFAISFFLIIIGWIIQWKRNKKKTTMDTQDSKLLSTPHAEPESADGSIIFILGLLSALIGILMIKSWAGASGSEASTYIKIGALLFAIGFLCLLYWLGSFISKKLRKESS
jgi:hypothetical protein